jgi:hypothetical protein
MKFPGRGKDVQLLARADETKSGAAEVVERVRALLAGCLPPLGSRASAFQSWSLEP